MRVIVIGSRGYMGSRLVNRLSIDGIDVFGLSSTDGTGIDPVSGLLPKDFELQEATDVVVYMAQSPFFRQMPEKSSHLMAVNYLSAIRAASAAREAGVGRFIYVSTGTVYAPSFLPLIETSATRRDDWYALSKIHAEEALALFRSEMEVCCVRPFGVYGPDQPGRLLQNLWQSVQEGRPITLQAASHEDSVTDGLRISLCYVDDAVEILMSLIRQGGPDVLNLAGKDALSIRAMAEAIGSLIGIAPAYSVANTKRNGDLVGSIDLLAKTVSVRFTPFYEGLATSIPKP